MTNNYHFCHKFYESNQETAVHSGQKTDICSIWTLHIQYLYAIGSNEQGHLILVWLSYLIYKVHIPWIKHFRWHQRWPPCHLGPGFRCPPPPARGVVFINRSCLKYFIYIIMANQHYINFAALELALPVYEQQSGVWFSISST